MNHLALNEDIATRTAARKLIACVSLAFALLVPAASNADWKVTKRENADGTTWTYRTIKPTDFSITRLPEPAPPNDCPGLAFEIANPKPGEAPCVGYLHKRR
ncbi:hypothetical protein [Bosea sp. RAC05]|uniref:hypothetical protein n=1 Tax=Bosea sp. RAC05 TaxID=1842539 RepID=UPI00083CE85C|nr:hypothetical protein [Bosea sp. RAC05]AOG03111.1 hypothetical protein BSY19_5158 [Bosea sp. RAC05]